MYVWGGIGREKGGSVVCVGGVVVGVGGGRGGCSSGYKQYQAKAKAIKIADTAYQQNQKT